MSAARISALLLATLVCGLPVPGWANPVTVRSGEHDGFTRLVLDLPRPRGWTVEQEGRTARLVLNGKKVDFDLSNSFRKITTGRIIDLFPAADANALTIALNCDCKIDAFRLGNEMLVIDIRGAPASAGGQPRPPARPVPPILETATSTIPAGSIPLLPFSSHRPDRTARLKFGPHPQDRNVADLPDIQTAERFTEPAPSVTAPGLVVPSSAQPSGRDPRITEAERRLAEQLSRAVSQGLVTSRAAHLPEPAEQHHEPTLPSTAPNKAAKSGTPAINLRAQTSADRDFLEALGVPVTTLNGETCISTAKLEISSWAGEGTFSQEVGRLRGSLMGEFDRPDPDAGLALARLYLHYGFGAEARHVLKAAPVSQDDLSLLQTLADIIEFGHGSDTGVFANQFDCDTSAALWAVLSVPTVPGMAKINDNAVLRAINALPPHLRTLLGPTASERLRAAGHEPLSAQLLDLVERGVATSDPRLDFSRAGQALVDDDLLAASTALQKVVETNTELSPKALIQLIESRLSRKLPIDMQMAELAGAYALEYRKQPLGVDLKRVHILALAEAGAYDLAFAELAHFAPFSDPETVDQMRGHAMAALAANGGTLPFLKYALRTGDASTTALDASSENAVAARLLDLGFPAQAASYLQTDAIGAQDKIRRILRARVALAEMKPRRAEADLLGLSGPEADKLRARARSMSGDHAVAQRLFATLDQKEAMVEQAWLAGDWTVLRASDDPLLAEVAGMATQNDRSAGSSEAETGVLARNHALLENSIAARGTMNALLTRYATKPIPVTND